MSLPVYLDAAASTPVDPQVAAAMLEVLRAPWGGANPASEHAAGAKARQAVATARRQVAGLIGAEADEILWTSGATESDNLAIRGAAAFQAARGKHVITALTEHAAVLQSCRALESAGYPVSWLSPNADGIVEPEQLAAALRPETTLVSLSLVNNELGVIHDIAAMGEICRAHGALLHVDAAQAAGRLPIDVRRQQIDLLSLSAHKMYGPKGIGALFLDAGRCRRVEPLLYGGGQERGLRPGTLATHQVVGMGLAAALAQERLDSDPAKILALREQLEKGLLAVPDIRLNGSPERRACHIVNVSVPGVEGESLRCALREFAIASGAACSAESPEPSPVLRSLGLPDQLAHSSLRISLGRDSTPDEVTRFVDAFGRAVARLRALAA